MCGRASEIQIPESARFVAGYLNVRYQTGCSKQATVSNKQMKNLARHITN